MLRPGGRSLGGGGSATNQSFAAKLKHTSPETSRPAGPSRKARPRKLTSCTPAGRRVGQTISPPLTVRRPVDVRGAGARGRPTVGASGGRAGEEISRSRLSDFIASTLWRNPSHVKRARAGAARWRRLAREAGAGAQLAAGREDHGDSSAIVVARRRATSGRPPVVCGGGGVVEALRRAGICQIG